MFIFYKTNSNLLMYTNKFPEQEKTKCKQGGFYILLKKLSLHPL